MCDLGPGGKQQLYSVFIIDERGEIVHKKLGTAKWSHPSVIDFLRRL